MPEPSNIFYLAMFTLSTGVMFGVIQLLEMRAELRERKKK